MQSSTMVVSPLHSLKFRIHSNLGDVIKKNVKKMLIAVVDKLIVILFLFLTLTTIFVSSTSESSEETVLEGKHFIVESFLSNQLATI